ncbi:MAG: cytochrome P450, partial [Acidimicrobiales bacterium]
LLGNPDQLDDLASHPELMANAVDELLRFDSPVQLTMRVALDDAEAGGTPVKKGTFTLLLIGAANRDPRAFEDPDRLDIRRPPSSHLAFGQGIHFCLGAPLARLEAQIALRALLGTFGTLRLSSAPAWRSNAVLRGVERLEVEVAAEIRA